MIGKTLAVLACATFALSASSAEKEPEWISLFNGKDLTGWTPRGKAAWSVQDGVLVGIGGMGHIYTDAIEYKSGHFAIQGHNPGMKVEAKELYYRDLSK